MPNIKIRNLIPATGGDITSGNFIASALNTGEGHERVTRKVTYEQVVSGGAVFADFSEGLNVSGNPVITGFRTPTPDGGLAISGNNDILYIGSVEDDDNREVHIQYQGEDSIIIDSNNDVKIEKNLLVQDGEIRGKVGKFSEDLLVDGKKVLISTPAPGGGIGFGGGAGDDDPVAFTQNGQTRIKLESDGTISFNNVSNFKAGASFDPYITLAVQTDAPSSLANKLYNKSGNLWWEGWQIAPAVDMTNGFSPEEDNTGNVGTSTNAWANGNFHNLNVSASADISNLSSSNLTVTQKIEYAAGSASNQGESSPTGATPSLLHRPSQEDRKRLSSNLMWTIDGKYAFAFSIFGNLARRPAFGVWNTVKTDTFSASDYLGPSHIFSAKLSDKSIRLAAVFCKTGANYGSKKLYSDDLGQTWASAKLIVSGYRYNGWQNKEPYDIGYGETIDQKTAVVSNTSSVQSFWTAASSHTWKEHYENSNTGDRSLLGNSIYSALNTLSIASQKYMEDDIFVVDPPGRQGASENDALKLVKHIYSDSLKTSDRNPNSRLVSGGGKSAGNNGRVEYDPTHDFLYYATSSTSYSTSGFYARGLLEMRYAIINGTTIDQQWIDDNNVWVMPFDHNGSVSPRPFSMSDSMAIKTIANDYVIFVNGERFLPVQALNAPELFPHVGNYSTNYPVDSYKVRNIPFSGHYKPFFIDDKNMGFCNILDGRVYRVDTEAVANILNVSNGVFDEEAYTALFTKVTETVYIQGTETVLAGEGGEGSNPSESFRNDIVSYDCSGIDGEVIGVGKQGKATSRTLPITEYEDVNAIWNNTLSNGITVPNFRRFSTYNKRNQKITTHFESNGAYKSGEPLSIGAGKEWSISDSADLTETRTLRSAGLGVSDKNDLIYDGNTGGYRYITRYNGSGRLDILRQISLDRQAQSTNAHFGHVYSGNIGKRSIAHYYPGMYVDYDANGITTFTYLDKNHQKWQDAGVSEDPVMVYRRFTRMGAYQNYQGGESSCFLIFKDTSYATLLDSIPIIKSTNNDMAPTNSHLGAGTIYAGDGNYVSRRNRSSSSISAYPLKFSGYPFLGQPDYADIHKCINSEGEPYLCNRGIVLNLLANDSSKRQATYYSEDAFSILFTSDFTDTSTWDIKVTTYNSRIDVTNLFTINRRVDNDAPYYTFLDITVPNFTTIDSTLTDLGLTESEKSTVNPYRLYDIDGNATDKSNMFFRVELHAGNEWYYRIICIRDGGPADWPDEPKDWQFFDNMPALGNSWIFNSYVNILNQMPNGDLIAKDNGRTNFCIVPRSILRGNGDYLEDPSWGNNIATNGFNQTLISVATQSNSELDTIENTYLNCRLTEDSMLVWCKKGSSYYLGYIETDGSGNLVHFKKVNTPSTSFHKVVSFNSNRTTYYLHNNQIWFTDSDAIVTEARTGATTVSPTWVEIPIENTGLLKMVDILYHPDADRYYILGESGLYSISVNGNQADDWSIEIQPQYSFASQPTTGLFKDLDHKLHLVQKGEPCLTVTEDHIHTLKNFGINILEPESLLVIKSRISTGSDKLVSLLDADETEAGHITIDTDANTANYATSSDYRLKTNISEFSSSVERLLSLKPCSWEWKKNGVKGEGFLAHEVQEVVPVAVTGTKDEVKTKTKIIPAEYKEIKIKEEIVDETTNEVSLETVVKKIIVQEEKKVVFETPVYQGIDYSKIVPLLTAALQETIKEVQTLKKKIDELENQ
jgi:hypothetical protein